MGFMKSLGSFFKSKPATTQVADVRSPGERALNEAQVSHFQGLMNQPDWGYKSESAAQDPIYERERRRMEEQISGAAAARGFGALRHGPSMELSARGSQEMGENRAAMDVERRDAYRQWVQSAGRESANPQGRTAFMQPGRPSAFSALAGPVMTAAGAAFGGPLGAGLAGGFANMLGGKGGGFSQGFQTGAQGYGQPPQQSYNWGQPGLRGYGGTRFNRAG